MSLLDPILERKRVEVETLRRERGEASLRADADAADPSRGFAVALRAGDGARVIAEFKRASPSKGTLRADADPAEIARAYADAGAVALSVLTDRRFFQGDLQDLRAARAACALPVLRKDFVIDPLQILEARAAGADAILLIVAALEDGPLRDLHALALGLGLAALVEVHTEEEVERALAAGAEIVGVNNRDLHTFKTDVAVTRRLKPLVPDCTIVSESGLDDPEVIGMLAEEGVHAFLIGEALMRAAEPGEELRRLRLGRRS